MCTIGAKKINEKYIIFKNRDRSDNVHTKIIFEDNGIKKLLIVDEKSHCEGLNEYGLCFIETTLSPHCTRKYNTVSGLGRRILNQKNIVDAIDIIKRNKISSNIIISDGKVAFTVERTPSEIAITKLRNYGVITNHSIKLNKLNGPKDNASRKSSVMRFNRAKKLVKAINNNNNNIKKVLSDTYGRYPIYNEFTICSYILDPIKKQICFFDSKPNSKGQMYCL